MKKSKVKKEYLEALTDGAKEIGKQANKTMKQLQKEETKDREIYALKHQVDSLRKQREQNELELKIKDAQLKAADMYISYLASLVCDNGEVVLPFEKLAEFKVGYTVKYKHDEVTKDITIRIVKKENKIE